MFGKVQVICFQSPGYVIRGLLSQTVIRLNSDHGEIRCDTGIDDIS